MRRTVGTSIKALVAATALAVGMAASSAPPADEATGAIIIYRGDSIMGAAVGCPVRYDGTEVVELGRGRKAMLIVEPGRYILGNKTSSVEVNVAAGETRYVRCMVKSGMLTGRADLQIVDKASYSAVRDSLRASGPPVSLRHSLSG